MRHGTIKLEENIVKTFSDIHCSSVFLGQSPKVIETKIKTGDFPGGLSRD